MAENNENQQVKIELKPDVAQGEYSNLAMINHSSSEFVIDFAHMLPIAPPQIATPPGDRAIGAAGGHSGQEAWHGGKAGR